MPLAAIFKIIQGAQGTGGAVMDALPYIIKTDYEKENKKRLEELSRQREMDALGLTEAEKQQISKQYSNPVMAAQEQQMAEQRRILSSQAGTGAGAGQAQLQRNDAAMNKAIAARADAIAAADAQKEKEQEAEYWSRLAWQGQKKQERVAAWSSIGKAAIKGKQEDSALSSMTGSGGSTGQQAVAKESSSTASSAEVQAFAKQYGISEEKAAEYMKYMQDNPEFAESLNSMANSSNSGS